MESHLPGISCSQIFKITIRVEIKAAIAAQGQVSLGRAGGRHQGCRGHRVSLYRVIVIDQYTGGAYGQDVIFTRGIVGIIDSSGRIIDRIDGNRYRCIFNTVGFTVIDFKGEAVIRTIVI